MLILFFLLNFFYMLGNVIFKFVTCGRVNIAVRVPMLGLKQFFKC